MNSFLGIDNPIMNFLSTVFDLIILNLCFLICCLPLITIGPSITALYAVTMKMAKKEESYIFRGFFTAFLSHFKQAVLFWLLCVVFFFFILIDYRIIFLSGRAYLHFLIAPTFFIALLGFCVFFYIFPILAYCGGSWKKVFKKAVLTFFRHIPSTCSMLAILMFTGFLSFLNSRAFSLVLSFFTIIGFSALSFLLSKYFHRILDQKTASF